MNQRMTGADPLELRRAAAQLEDMAAALDGCSISVHGVLFTAPWHGPGADHFRDLWHGRRRPHVAAAVADLEQAAAALKRQADEQDRASGTFAGLLIASPAFDLTRPSGYLDRDDPRLPYRIPFPEDERGPLDHLLKAFQFGMGRDQEWFNGQKVEDSSYQDAHHFWTSSGDGFAGAQVGDGTSWAGPIPGSAEYSAWAGAKGNYSAFAGVTSEGLTIGAALAGAVGAGASGSVSIGNQAAGASASGTAFAGARGDLQADIKLGPDGAKMTAGGHAFAGAEASGNIEGHAAGVSAGATGHAYAGIGVTAQADVQVTATHVKADIEIGAALGIGAGIDVHVDWNPGETIDAVSTAVTTLTSIFHF